MAGALAGGGQALPRNDHLLVLPLRAGPFRYLDGWRTGKPIAYQQAVAAFGLPSRRQESML